MWEFSTNKGKRLLQRIKTIMLTRKWQEMRAEGWSVWQIMLLAVAYPWMTMVNSRRSPIFFVGAWICYLAILAIFTSKTIAIAGACIPMAILLLSMASGAVLVTLRARSGQG